MQQMRNANRNAATPEECAATLLDVIPAVMRVIRGHMRRQRGIGLSVAQFRALGYVGRHAGTSLSALAEHIGLTPPATSRLVDGLVAREMMRRELSPTDRRAVMLSLTPAGAALLEEGRRHTQAELRTVVARLPEADRAAIVHSLCELQAAFFPVGTPLAGPLDADDSLPAEERP